MGRETKLNKDIQRDLVKLLKAGNFVETACRMVGITKQTFYNWYKKGKEGQEQNYVDFFDAIREAEAYQEVKAVELWSGYFEKDWRAIRDFLDRRHAGRWGGLQKVALTDPSGKKEFSGFSELKQEAKGRLDRLFERGRAAGSNGSNGKPASVDTGPEE